MKWFITIGKEETLKSKLSGLNNIIHGSGFRIYSTEPLPIYCQNDKQYFFLCEGNLLPRLNSKIETKVDNIAETFIIEYVKHGKDAINDFKGNFTILVGSEKGFHLFSDRLGIKKFLYNKSKTTNQISNDISLLRNLTNAQVDVNNISIYSITNRFPGGISMFDGIYHTPPACCLSFNDQQMDLSSYWSSEALYSLNKSKSTYKNFADFFLKIMKQYLDFYEPNDISLTLTGGSDSRIILGSLLHYGYNPKTFTFGYPESGDVKVARRLAKSLNLEFNNYYEATPTIKWFDNLTGLIKEKGNSLINFHRAYRLDGLLKEKERNPSSDMTIAGHAGGEPIRGLFYDNLIVPDFIKDFIPGKEGNSEKVINELNKRFIDPRKIDVDYVLEFINDLPYLKAQGKKREFLLIFNFLIENHLYQDLNLYDAYHNKIITPFMDIDYLEYLFSTQYSMLYKNNSSRNKLNKLSIPELQSNVIYEVYPPLANYQLNKGYSPAEYLKNKYLCAVKKAWRGYRNKKYRSSNFSYDSWFENYVKSRWPKEPSPWLNTFFELSTAEHVLNTYEHGRSEKYWIKFSSIIMLDEFSKYY
jgi:hypothetical protein